MKTTIKTMMAAAALVLATRNVQAEVTDWVDWDCRYQMNYPSSQQDVLMFQSDAQFNPDGKKEIELYDKPELITHAYDHPFAIDGREHVLTTYTQDVGFRLIAIHPERARALAQYCALHYLYFGYRSVMVSVKSKYGTYDAFVRRGDYANWQAIQSAMTALVPTILSAPKQTSKPRR